MKILLIEPNYKNKYPPIGLMKIATYHKNRGDYVYFQKGMFRTDNSWDRVYITSLFTFDFDLVLKTISHFKNVFDDHSKIYIGGIAVTLLESKFREKTGLSNLLLGRLTDSAQIGFDDRINIDMLIPDYDILKDSDYKYGTEDSLISYTSRGCINTCSFCAVPKLEGMLSTVNNISSQINTLRNQYGDKRNLLLLDNNILGFDEKYLENFVYELNCLGYVNEPSYIKPNAFKEIMDYYERQLSNGCRTFKILEMMENCFNTLANRKNISAHNKQLLHDILYEAQCAPDFFEIMYDRYDEIYDIFELYNYKFPLQRYIDFNQGLDARELTQEKMKILSRIPIRPYRFAFDSMQYKDNYNHAIRLAASHGVRHFSNYLLYNFDDEPIDLYERIMLNLELSEELNVIIYSFPMKFAPINKTDRKYIGSKWNPHFLRIFQSIINVTKGVVAGDRSFIETAFGKNCEEYLELLHMPHDFIVYRSYYKDLGLTDEWKKEFSMLSLDHKKILIDVLSSLQYSSDVPELNVILKFYNMRYNKIKEPSF